LFLLETGTVRSSTRVLIHACAGGVGNAALQVIFLKILFIGEILIVIFFFLLI